MVCQVRETNKRHARRGAIHEELKDARHTDGGFFGFGLGQMEHGLEQVGGRREEGGGRRKEVEGGGRRRREEGGGRRQEVLGGR